MRREAFEQPSDWTEPGAHPVATGVYRIPLPLPLSGLSAVNAYAVESADGVVLIDPGWASTENERILGEALRSIGYRFADISCCLATHHHWDHYTQAYAWRERFGVELFTGRGERFSIETYERQSGRFPNHPELLYRCGADDLASRLANDYLSPEYEVDVPFGSPDGWLDDGQRIQLSGGELDVFATPGHTRGHVVFRHREAGILFSGDHVLSTITPSLGFELAPEPHPLRSFLASLRLLLAQPDGLLLPAHGHVVASTHARVDELLQHHRQRLEDVRVLVHSGATTAYEVARELPWTRRNRRLESLAVEHQMSAVMEIEAHLDVLAVHGLVRAEETPSLRRYLVA
ncbi:MBL fold metallo-hydrolase [Sciscionella sediminilitoris]|uniref:MBL fold metallo-hydrolase n=1 Tax=Sciscionella sediminilitoris TaxID=1445613 RepID=UPI0004DEDA70|nr:MBL fold metallo-hydrolase [Sciscionella sp. SE31]